MLIEFTVCGLALHADIDYYPGIPAKLYGEPGDCYPLEDAEIEFSELLSDGENVIDLLNSDEADLITEAAIIAAGEYTREQKEYAAIARWEAMHELNYNF
jgi:hypothetical protein